MNAGLRGILLADPTVTPSLEFGPEQRAAFAISGAIALPSPFPASARITMGIMPRSTTPGADADAASQFFLKLVERLRDNDIVTRLVSLKDLRAIRFLSAPAQPGYPWAWTLKTREDLFTDLNTARKSLESALDSAGSPGPSFSFEVDLDSGTQGILYVPEASQILVRLEFGLLAAEAAQIASLVKRTRGVVCCHEDVPPITIGNLH